MNRNQLKEKLEKMAYLYDGRKENEPLLTLLEKENQKHDLSIRLSASEITDVLFKFSTIPLKNNAHYHIKKLSEVEEKPIEWIITNYIPKNEITVLCGDGGVGKGFVSSAIVCAISSGEQVFFESEEEYLKQNRQPQKVLFISSEEDISKIAKRKILSQGKANQENIYVVGAENEEIKDLKITSKALENVIHDIKPQLVIIDPLQSFMPPNTNMSDKSAMRDILGSLKILAVKEDTSFIILSHTNKRETSGRFRVGDSSEIWNVPRVVFMLGEVDENTRYLSQEKNNLGKKQQTTLFEVFDGQVIFKGVTNKRDEDFSSANFSKIKGNPREEIQTLILQELKENTNNTIENKELKELIVDNSGYSPSTFERAKKELVKNGKIEIKITGKGENRTSTISLKK